MFGPLIKLLEPVFFGWVKKIWYIFLNVLDWFTKSWERIAIAALIIFIAYQYYGLHIRDKQISELSDNYSKLKKEYLLSTDEYKKKIKVYESKKPQIENQTKAEIKYIDNFKELPNENKTDAANRLINSYNFGL